jgi:fermentation-respiration switch protein FrsA (DUF1100 family)
MYFYQEKLLFHPYTLASDFKYDFPGRYTEFTIPLGDGSRLDALHFYADTPAHGIVVYFHGNGEALDYTGSKAARFTSRGYDCLMVDYAGYGKSRGKLSEANLFLTGITLFDTAKRYFPTSRIVVYGRSLGTGIAAHTARDEAWFKALILEAPYYSITDVGRRQYPFLPIGLLSRYPISTYQYLKDIHHPVYAIHGTDDHTIPIESPRQFLKIGLRNFNFIEIPGAHHGDLADYKEYDQMLDKVLN